MNQRTGRGLLLLGALGFAIIGQFFFAKRPNNFWDAVVFYAAAVVCLLLLTRDVPASVEAEEQPARPRTVEEWARIGLAAAGALLAIATVLQLSKPQDSYWPIFWCWLFSIVLVLLAALPPWAELRGAVGGYFRSLLTWEALAVAGVVILALALRVWRIDSIPWTLGGDEGSQGLWARDVIAGRLPNMFGLGWLSVPNMSFYWQAAWFRLFGDDVMGLRLPWAVIGAGTVVGVYLLVRRLFDRWLALLTAALARYLPFPHPLQPPGLEPDRGPTLHRLGAVLLGAWPAVEAGVAVGRERRDRRPGLLLLCGFTPGPDYPRRRARLGGAGRFRDRARARSPASWSCSGPSPSRSDRWRCLRSGRPTTSTPG